MNVDDLRISMRMFFLLIKKLDQIKEYANQSSIFNVFLSRVIDIINGEPIILSQSSNKSHR